MILDRGNVAPTLRPLPPEGKVTRSYRVGCAISAKAKASLACAASSSYLAAAWLGLPTKNIENNPMQSSRQPPARMRFDQILDTSGKSAALLHHRTIR